MAKLRGSVNVRIDQDASSGTTCFGLPGYGGLKASMSNCHFNVIVAVYDDLSVYVGINGHVTDNVNPNIYASKMCVSPNDWNWVYDGTHLVGPGASWDADIDASDRNYDWTFSCGNPAQNSPAGSGYIYAGKLDQFHGTGTGKDGYLYLGGTGSYEVDDPIYPDPVRITVPGIMQYLDYFPWARRSGSSWASCNRSGGYMQSYRGGWTDRKNVAVGSGTNTVFRFDGANWVICPEIGDK